MKKSGFLLFLIISLALTAFFTGYIMVKRGVDTTISHKTGTILDKFTDSEPKDSNQIAPTDNTLTPLTEKRVTSVANSSTKGSVLYFEKNTGKLFELNLETKVEQPVLDKALLNLISAIWSPTKEEFIGVFTSGAQTVFKYFNINTGKEVSLDPNISSVAFSPDGSLIIYYSLEQTANQGPVGKIFVAEPDGIYQKKILDTRLEGATVDWPIHGKMAIRTSDSEMYFLTEDSKLTKLLESKPGLEEKWSPSGKKLLFSASSTDPGQVDTTLNILNTDSQKELNLEKGSVSKCVWSIDDINVFCAIHKTPSVDEVYKINTSDGTQDLIAEPLTQIRELLLSSAEDQLLFVSASNEKLYSIKVSD